MPYFSIKTFLFLNKFFFGINHRFNASQVGWTHIRGKALPCLFSLFTRLEFETLHKKN